MTAASIHQQIQDAIAKFGKHTFTDKGPHEVMDVDGIAESLAKLPPDEVLDVLKEVENLSGEEGALLTEAILAEYANSVVEEWNDLYAALEEIDPYFIARDDEGVTANLTNPTNLFAELMKQPGFFRVAAVTVETKPEPEAPIDIEGIKTWIRANTPGVK